MDDLIQYLPIIAIALTLLARVFRRKKPREPEPEVNLEGEQEVKLPAWGNMAAMDDLTSEPMPDFLQLDEQPPPRNTAPPPTPADKPQPAPEVKATKTVEQRPTSNQATRREEAKTPRTATRTIAGISLTPQTFRQGIILREILGPPKSLERRRTETEN